MLNAPIKLRPEQIKQFVQNLDIITQTFGTIPFSTGMTVQAGIFNIKVIAGLTILMDPKQIEGAISKFEKSKHRAKASKPSALKDERSRQVTGYTLVSELVRFFMVNRAPLMALNESAYHQSMGFLMLMSSLYGYNAAVTHENTIEGRGLKQQYIDKCIDWMTIFEQVNLPELKSDFWQDLRLILVQRLAHLKAKPVDQPQVAGYSDFILLPNELEQLIKRKNLRAKQFGIPCEMTVIHRHDSNMLFQIDLDTFALLKDQLEVIINTKATKEHHFLFYVNHDFGPVELLSARYNTTTETLELVNISGGNRGSQYYFLATLSSSLDAASVRYELHACQANMLRSANDSAFYAYLFSGILRSVAESQVKDKTFKTKQPVFFDAFEQKTKAFPTLKEVNWFDVGALGEKVLLLTPDHEAIKANFLKIQPNPVEAKIRFNYYMRKYNLIMSDLFEGHHRFYSERAYERAKLHLGSPGDSQPPFYIEIKDRILNDELDCEKEAQELEVLVKELERLKLSKAKTAKKPASTAKKRASRSKTSNEKKEVKLSPIKFIAKNAADVVSQAQEQDGKLLRRAAAGFCTLSEFEFLVDHPFISQSIDMFDEKRQYTPLQLSLTRQYPKRALILLQKGAQVDVKNYEGKSAQSIYEALPADSPIKKNEKIKPYFKA